MAWNAAVKDKNAMRNAVKACVKEQSLAMKAAEVEFEQKVAAAAINCGAQQAKNTDSGT